MPEATRTRCLMRFEEVLGLWRVDVMRDGRTLRSLTFADDFKIEEMARRGNGLRTLEAKNMLELAIRQKHGALDLYLTSEQLTKLSRV